MSSTANTEPCPECGRKDLKTLGALGIHRRFAHGVKGKTYQRVNGKPKRKYTRRGEHVEIPQPNQYNSEERINGHIAFAYGQTFAKLESYAASIGIPITTLAEGVGQLLHNETRRSVLGTRHRVPSLSAKTAA
jgi:hypothetical protein